MHLRGVHTLDMSCCSQPTITDAAFAHLRGIHTLSMSYCNQATITDAAFAHLRGIHTLNMSCICSKIRGPRIELGSERTCLCCVSGSVSSRVRLLVCASAAGNALFCH